MADPDAPFYCIRCWDPEEAYPHEIKGDHAVRASLPELNLGKTAVISFVLAGSEDFGDPTKAAFDALNSYLKGNVIFFRITFNFSSMAAVKRLIGHLMEELKSPAHQDIDRFLVSLTSHSDPSTGDVHTCPNNQTAAPLAEVLSILLPPEMRTILRRGEGPSHNIFVLHSCGAVVRLKRPINDLKVLAADDVFKEVVAFDQEHLQPALTYGFITDASRAYFVYNYASMTTVLGDHHTLGAHTGLVVFTKALATRFIWCHPVKQPFGERVSSQCKNCKRCPGFVKVRADQGSETRPNFDLALLRRCKGCGDSTRYSFPAEGKWLKNRPPGEDHRGAWLVVPLTEPES
ncbi:hypothetical protein BKA70DRAFT_1422613 [Coprinopsis sp. MPI-PUGE-AT-0042]|nr:hypothetical protein BKA70DRAFT_1422613 [Coprinopsis sp. MPI-PUGE-AT-0042]